MAEDGASINSAASTRRARASPKRGGGDSTAQKKRSIDSTSMAPLTKVKPSDYEVFLLGYLNSHPTFGIRKLLKALEDYMHATCRKQSM